MKVDSIRKHLEKGLRSERALLMALAEMYVQGVSTRKVAAITERLCGTQVSASQVSRAAEQLDEGAWKSGAHDHWVKWSICIWMRVMRKCGRQAVCRDAAILMASGVKKDGKTVYFGRFRVPE